MASLLDLEKKIKDLFNQGGKLAQGAANQVGRYGNFVANNFQQQMSNPVRIGGNKVITDTGYSPLPQAQFGTPYYNVLKGLSGVQQGIQDYATNRIQKPAEQSRQLMQSGGVLNKALGAAGALGSFYNATPLGVGTNLALGSVAGVGQSLRTGQSLPSSIKQGTTTNASPTAMITGYNNAATNLIGDIALGNPKSALNVFTKTKNIVSALKGVNPKAFDLHPDDAEELAQIGQAILKKQPLSFKQNATLERTFKYLYPGYKLDKMSNKKIADVIGATLDRYSQVPKGQRTPFPAMGIADQSIRKNNVLGSYTNVKTIDNRLAPVVNNLDDSLKGQTVNQAKQSPRLKVEKAQPRQQEQPFFLSDEDFPDKPTPTQILPSRSTGQKELSGNNVNRSNPLVDDITNKPGLSNTDKNVFADWVNSRRAIETEKLLTKREFQDLDNLGVQGFFEIQAGGNSDKFAKVRQYLNSKFTQANKEAGIDFNYQEDYLPQVWNNTPQQIEQVFGKRVTTRPGFTMEKVIDDYKTGIAAGLTPKFTKISDLLADYEGRVNKAIADRNFFNHMRKSNMLLPASQAPQGWATVNPDRFPKIRATINGIEMKEEGPFKAPVELASMINNYLYNPSTDGSTGAKLLSNIADYVSRVKNITLSFGIPFTAINSHGVNILARHTLFGQGGNIITRFVKGATYLVNKHSSGNKVEEVLEELPTAIKKGLTIGVEDRKSILESTGLRSKFGEAWSKTFEEALFDRMIPALKFDSYKALVKDFSKQMPLDEAQREAAKMVNNIYGGINWEQVGRDRNMQNFLRSVILAPDWAETTLRLGGNFAKALKSASPVSRKYQNMMASFITAYLGANVANKLSSGRFMWENDPGHTFEIEAGYTEDGQKRYIRPFGTGMDMFRIPYDVVLSLAKGDLSAPARIVRNRTSIPVGVGIGMLSDQDYRGRSIGYRGTDKYGGQIPFEQRAINIGSELASLVGVPNFIRQVGATTTGQQGIEQGLTQAVELPLRYQSPGSSKTQKFVGEVSDLKGKDLFELKKRFQGEAPFSEKQKQTISVGGIEALNNVMEQRNQTRTMNKAKEIQKDVSVGKISKEEGEKALDRLLRTQTPQQKQFNSGDQAYASDTKIGDTIFTNDFKTINLAPPTKGKGIDAFVNKNWKFNKAREVWKADISNEQKIAAFKKLGVKEEDVRYDYLANHNDNQKSEYIQSKNLPHDQLIEQLMSGRVVSVSGQVFASDGVLKDLQEKGLITPLEERTLKKMKLNKSGESIIKASTGTGGRKKGASVSIKNITIPKTSFKPIKIRRLPTVKLTKSSKVHKTTVRTKNLKLSVPGRRRDYKVKVIKIQGLQPGVKLL